MGVVKGGYVYIRYSPSRQLSEKYAGKGSFYVA